MLRGQPLHTVERDRLLEYLRSQTNDRVEADPSAESGYRVIIAGPASWHALPGLD